MEKSIRKYWPLFVLPTMLAFTIGFLIPFAMGLYLSFCEFTTVSDAQFIGLANYIKIFTDPTSNLLHSLWMTSLFTIVNVVLINVAGFVVALLLVRGFRGTNIFRTVFFMPNLIGGIVLGWVWNLLLSGILANFGRTLVYSESYGFWGLTVLMLWQQAGYMMIIYIAGLQSIPDDLIEAASIDGATPLQTLFKVKIPMVMPSITICTFLTLTNSFKLFDQNLALLSAESSGRLKLLALDIYETFYGRPGWEGAGQAKAVVFTIIVAVLAIAQMQFTNKKEVQR
ncbi:MAG: sugar ABC transporter permease [Clostridia bacterium]|nr:sugar ABC transporter permease [Clostridia bacterium]